VRGQDKAVPRALRKDSRGEVLLRPVLQVPDDGKICMGEDTAEEILEEKEENGPNRLIH
jgi:hypothetical protein